jgi:hypothetical protein
MSESHSSIFISLGNIDKRLLFVSFALIPNFSLFVFGDTV